MYPKDCAKAFEILMQEMLIYICAVIERENTTSSD